jgi:hypothetical protein
VKPLTLAASVIFACVAFVGSLDFASSQEPRCSFRNGTPAACGSNPASPSTAPGLTGAKIAPDRCAKVLIYGIASRYSYDDLACYDTLRVLPAGTARLKFIGDALDYLTPNWKRIIGTDSNSRGRLYCTDNNVLILAFTGSLPPASVLDFGPNGRDDWIYTNILQHLGERPLQYQFAEDAADAIETRLGLGAYDGVCGTGRPKLILTGHSKGGGQAQYAAFKIKLDAIVFNSDLVNAVISNDFLLSSSWVQRLLDSATACRGILKTSLKPYVDYLATGRVKDIRMVNDPLGKFLFEKCGDNWPHAPIEWVSDSLDCSTDGHAIETVLAELKACAH